MRIYHRRPLFSSPRLKQPSLIRLLTAWFPGECCLKVVEREIGGTTAIDDHCSGSWPMCMASVAKDLKPVRKPANKSPASCLFDWAITVIFSDSPGHTVLRMSAHYRLTVKGKYYFMGLSYKLVFSSQSALIVMQSEALDWLQCWGRPASVTTPRCLRSRLSCRCDATNLVFESG